MYMSMSLTVCQSDRSVLRCHYLIMQWVMACIHIPSREVSKFLYLFLIQNYVQKKPALKSAKTTASLLVMGIANNVC